VDPWWFERDAFWETVRPALFETTRWNEAEREVVQALALLGVAPPDRILDVACGPGRHLLPLAEFGYSATGVDRTASYLAEATVEALARGLDIHTIHADVRSLAGKRPEMAESLGVDATNGLFHGAIWLDTSIGYSPRKSDDLDALTAVRGLLRPGARLVLETLGLECGLGRDSAASESPPEASVEAALVDGAPWVLQRRITAEGWMEVRWGPAAGHPVLYRHRLYSASDIVDTLRDVQFRNITLHGDLTGTPYGPAASTLVAVAER